MTPPWRYWSHISYASPLFASLVSPVVTLTTSQDPTLLLSWPAGRLETARIRRKYIDKLLYVHCYPFLPCHVKRRGVLDHVLRCGITITAYLMVSQNQARRAKGPRDPTNISRPSSSDHTHYRAVQADRNAKVAIQGVTRYYHSPERGQLKPRS
ncbi:hypothetical protein BJV77DRAFT_259820 [Russula vinacea]|nr:hypothetical protein BJV77DRAFT_259820 [Russula vinacea]